MRSSQSCLRCSGNAVPAAVVPPAVPAAARLAPPVAPRSVAGVPAVVAAVAVVFLPSFLFFLGLHSCLLYTSTCPMLL